MSSQVLDVSPLVRENNLRVPKGKPCFGGREAIFSHEGGMFEQMCYLRKRPSQIRSVITWGLRRGNPLVRSTSFGFVFEWAEQVEKAVRSPAGFRTLVSVSCDCLAGCPPSALCLTKFHILPLKVFSHVDPVYVRTLIRHPQAPKIFNYILEGYPLSPSCFSIFRTESLLCSPDAKVQKWIQLILNYSSFYGLCCGQLNCLILLQDWGFMIKSEMQLKNKIGKNILLAFLCQISCIPSFLLVFPIFLFL